LHLDSDDDYQAGSELLPRQTSLLPKDTLLSFCEESDSFELAGNQGFDFIEHMQQIHSLLDIEFDSIHTIDFFRLMQKMPGKILPLDFFDNNLPKMPDWATLNSELKERLMN
jgi:hypothetical protein